MKIVSIADATKAKREVEREILKLLANYEKDVGMSVRGVDLQFQHPLGSFSPMVIDVTLDVRLP